MFVPKALLAVSLAVLVPAVVGVPVISPLVAMLRPEGKLEALNVIGAVPVAVTTPLNGSPTVPLKELAEVIVGASSIHVAIFAEFSNDPLRKKERVLPFSDTPTLAPLE